MSVRTWNCQARILNEVFQSNVIGIVGEWIHSSNLIFSTKRTTPEILTKFQELGLEYTSNDLSRDLSNLVTQKILEARKITKSIGMSQKVRKR